MFNIQKNMLAKINYSVIFTVLLLSVVMIFNSIAMAHDGHNLATTESSENFEHQKEMLKEQYREAAKQKIEAAREAAKQRAEESKKEVENRKEVLKKNCESRSAGLALKIQNITQAASRHQSRIDSFNVKINDFKITRQLNVENYDNLYLVVQSKAAASQAAVDQLVSFDGNLDCNNITDVSGRLNAFKEAVNNAKTALSEYRSATKDLLVSVKTASAAEESDSSTISTSENEGVN